MIFYTIGMYCCHSCVFCVFDTKKRRKNDNSGGRGGKAMLDTFDLKILLIITVRNVIPTPNVSSIASKTGEGLDCFRCILFVPPTNNNESSQEDLAV